MFLFNIFFMNNWEKKSKIKKFILIYFDSWNISFFLTKEKQEKNNFKILIRPFFCWCADSEKIKMSKYTEYVRIQFIITLLNMFFHFFFFFLQGKLFKNLLLFLKNRAKSICAIVALGNFEYWIDSKIIAKSWKSIFLLSLFSVSKNKIL